MLAFHSSKNVFLLDQALPNRRWYMKIDDDTLVVPETLVDELSKYAWRQPYLIGCPYFLILDRQTLKQKIYGRPLKPWGSQPDDQFGPVSENFMYAGGGSGYVWSWGMMQLLKRNLPVIEDYCVRSTFEDVGFGLAVAHFGGKVRAKVLPK